MIVTYIHHSCFVVELENCVMIFDYFKGKLPAFDRDRKIYIFSSHSHHDHFNPDIFGLSKEYVDITYILSEDIKSEGMNGLNNNVIHVGANEALDCGDLHIETLTSTDQGVAFLVHVLGQSIYYAGDLNWWSWKGESKTEYEDMTCRFMKEMDKLEGKGFDIAFHPLDPRQEERFWWGFHHFMKTTRTKMVFPMHFWGDYGVISKLKKTKEAQGYVDKIVDITEKGQKFYIEKE